MYMLFRLTVVFLPASILCHVTLGVGIPSASHTNSIDKPFVVKMSLGGVIIGLMKTVALAEPEPAGLLTVHI